MARGAGGREGRALDAWPVGQRRADDRDLLERALAADAARRGRVEPPPRRLAQQRPFDLDDVAGEVLGRPRRARLVDQSLTDQEPERELVVVARRAPAFFSSSPF